MPAKNPIQPIVTDEHGIIRYKENTVVALMVALLKERGVDLNVLHARGCDLPTDDWDQFNQLIGYSVANGPVSDDIIDAAEKMAENPEMDQWQARALAAEEKLFSVRNSIVEGIAELYGTHPDNLTERV